MRKCKKIRKCARGVYAPGKFEKRKSSRPENRQGSISIGPGKFARGVKCAPAPPANPAPSGPARKRRPRPRIAGPDATRPAQERPALPALPRSARRSCHSSARAGQEETTGPGPEISPDPWKLRQRPAAPGRPTTRRAAHLDKLPAHAAKAPQRPAERPTLPKTGKPIYI